MTEKKDKIVKRQANDVAKPEQFTITPEEVLKYINPYATTKEVYIFIKQCEMFNLNPFKREIYLIKYDRDKPASYVIGFEVFIKRAERSTRLDGWEWGTEGSPDKPKECKAWIKIYRKDWSHPFTHEVFYEEYVGKKRDGTATKFWKEKWRTMLKKVVASQGFKLCFSEELGGFPYVAEEINTIDQEKLQTGKIKKLSTIPPPEGEIPEALMSKSELEQAKKTTGQELVDKDFEIIEAEVLEDEPDQSPTTMDVPPDDYEPELFEKPKVEPVKTANGDALKALGAQIHKELGSMYQLGTKEKASFMEWLFNHQEKKSKKYLGADSKGLHLSMGNLADLKELHSSLPDMLRLWEKGR